MRGKLEILTLRAMEDNFIHMLVRGSMAAVVDPGDPAPVLEILDRRGLELKTILITHGHFDHTAGCAELRRVTDCDSLGPAGTVDSAVVKGDEFELCGSVFRAISTPGHTASDICYYSEGEGLLFCGDTLFLCGCGRVFGGAYRDMWKSLKRLSALPGDTRIYCGHDYTKDNIAFALTVEHENQRLQERGRGSMQCVGSMEEELATNPFLRTESFEIRKNLGLADADAAVVFERLRKAKNGWG